MTGQSYQILITIDVEDWFQVENFKKNIPFSSWDTYKIRVENNVHRLLDLMDAKSEGNGKPIRATFFVLGWIAERAPNLVKQISERGHEVASHGYGHNLLLTESPKELKEDLIKSKELLEDIIGKPVQGYRAPSFSINTEALKIVEKCGFLYDCSYNSFNLHHRYGHISLSNYEKQGIAFQISNTFWELPISNYIFGRYVFPMGGGFYFRFIPFVVFKKFAESILKNYSAYMLYIHPWEIDPDQPRVHNASMSNKFRHYANLKHTYAKLARFLNEFCESQCVTCLEYLRRLKNRGVEMNLYRPDKNGNTDNRK